MITEDTLLLWSHKTVGNELALIAEVRRLRKRLGRAEDLLDESMTWYGDNRSRRRKVSDFLIGSK